MMNSGWLKRIVLGQAGETAEMAAKPASEKAKPQRVFGQARKPAKMFCAGLYARVSTNDQQTIPLQIRALREYAPGEAGR
jgi:hypothetical protein